MLNIILLLKAVALGAVEGLTEFLPISSTGHLILAGDLLNFEDDKAKVFQIVIQTGAMFAIIWEYRQRFAGAITGLTSDPAARRFVLNLLVAFIPAALLGFLFGDFIKINLFAAVPVAFAFIAGGLVILAVERSGRTARVASVDEMTPADALKVGLAQCAALIPGTSRSGATIIGAMLFGLSRRAATEFSFFLAVPTLIAAGAYDFYKHRHLFDASDLTLFGVGLITAFASAFACVRWLLRYIVSHDFTPFAWYRIVFGAVVLTTAYTGLVDWSLN
jgi:undecaprenyl-diphosphatase